MQGGDLGKLELLFPFPCIDCVVDEPDGCQTVRNIGNVRAHAESETRVSILHIMNMKTPLVLAAIRQCYLNK